MSSEAKALSDTLPNEEAAMEQEKQWLTGLDYVKHFALVVVASLFVQITIWAIYSHLNVGAMFSASSALISALLYHGIQLEENIGLRRRTVFFAAILVPFILGVVGTVYLFFDNPNLTLYNAEADGVSPMVELIALYATRLTINGVILLLFALADGIYLKNRSET